MPDFNFQERDVTRLVTAVLDAGAVYASTSDERPQIIHFEEDKEGGNNIFIRNCGGGHRMLTRGAGGVGKGDIGPNLSGFFSDFYFRNLKGAKPWGAIGLEQWLKNPRDIRDNAQMSPVHLKKDEFNHLLRIFDNGLSSG